MRRSFTDTIARRSEKKFFRVVGFWSHLSSQWRRRYNRPGSNISGDELAALSDCRLSPRQLRPVHTGRRDGGGDPRPQSRNDRGGRAEVRRGLGTAHTLRAQPDGNVRVTDGPYLETKELVGGITIVETATLD